MIRRFFFGCSFTSYKYPTWADIIIKNSDVESYNYGITGASNETIAKTVTFADLKHNFTQDDELYILWTHWWRKNLATQRGDWICKGNVFRTDWPKSHCKKFINYTDLAIANTHGIIQTNKAYNVIKNLHWKQPCNLEGPEFTIPTFAEKRTIKYVLQFIPYDDILPPYDETIDVYWKKDCHPTMLWHLELAKRLFSINSDVEQWVTQYHQKIKNIPQKEYWEQQNFDWAPPSGQEVFKWGQNGNK